MFRCVLVCVWKRAGANTRSDTGYMNKKVLVLTCHSLGSFSRVAFGKIWLDNLGAFL